jgi:hypothetical protein
MVQAWGCDATLHHMAVSINIDVGIVWWDGKKQMHNTVDQAPESQMASTVRETVLCGSYPRVELVHPHRGPPRFLAKSKICMYGTHPQHFRGTMH